jgi:beta-lactamase regulating signal transducer with metallopeptidase domain
VIALNFAAGAALLLDAALKGAVVLACALAATRLMRRASAASRHLVWAVSLAAVVALPVLAPVLPAWKVLPVPVLGPSPSPHVFTVAPAAAAPRSEEERGPADEVAASAAELTSPATASPAPAMASTPARGSFSFDWRLSVLALWALGVALLAARLAYGVARVWWLRRRAVEITDESWVRIVDGLARRLRVGRMVTLLREQRTSVPMTWGVISPVVLLPGEADAWNDERRTVVLAHELAHVRRWDAATQWIAHVALALFWFNPLTWVAARRLREEREHACDDAVLAIGTRPAAYADHLLDIVRSLGAAEGPAPALAMARRSQFEGRLLAILDAATPRGDVSRRLGLAVLLVAAAALLPLAAVRAADPPAPAEASAAEPPRGRARPDEPESGRGKRNGAALPWESEAEAPTQQDTGSLLTLVRTLDGDEARADLLTRVANQPGRRGYADVARAAAEIGEPAIRTRVLREIIDQPQLSAADVEAVLRTARGIRPDADKRHVLIALANRHSLPASSTRRAYFGVLSAFANDSERRYVLCAVVERPRLSRELLLDALRATTEMRSDEEKRYVLTAAAENQRLDPGGRDAYLAVVRTIGSEDERRYALDALLPPADAASGAPSDVPSRARSPWSTEIRLDLEGGRRVEIRAVNVRVGATYDEVLGFERGGSLLVRESVPGRTRTVRGVPAANGTPRFEYQVDGEVRPFESEERDWMRRIIREFT